MSLTENVYAGLPDFYRVADEQVDQALPLRRFLSLLGDQMDPVDELVETAYAGALTDPSLTPPQLVPWLAQLVGVRLRRPATIDALRAAVAAGSGQQQAGTRESIAQAARTVLTDDRAVLILPHDGIPDGDPWVILVGVREAEAPAGGLPEVEAAILDAGVKPSGYRLHVVYFAPTWDQIDAVGEDWDDYRFATFNELEGAAWAAAQG